jgi:hypothetical protein
LNKFSFDPSLLNVSEEAANKTHFETIHVEIFRDVDSLFPHYILSFSGKTFVDQRYNYCKFLKNPRNGVVINFLKEFNELADPRLLECPIKKGKFVALKPRRIPSNFHDLIALPQFLPLKGIFNFTLILKTKIRGKLAPVYQKVQVIEIY